MNIDILSNVEVNSTDRVTHPLRLTSPSHGVKARTSPLDRRTIPVPLTSQACEQELGGAGIAAEGSTGP